MVNFERRIDRLETKIEVQASELKATRRALKLQAVEYERRLKALNGENARVLSVQARSVTADKFEDYKLTQETAQDKRNEMVDRRLKSIEDWRSKATGIGVVLVLISGAVGAAIMKVLLG